MLDETMLGAEVKTYLWGSFPFLSSSPHLLPHLLISSPHTSQASYLDQSSPFIQKRQAKSSSYLNCCSISFSSGAPPPWSLHGAFASVPSSSQVSRLSDIFTIIFPIYRYSSEFTSLRELVVQDSPMLHSCLQCRPISLPWGPP